MSKKNPVKLSIALATNNQEVKLSRALDSIFEQKHDHPFEIIICDDCSTDKTQEVIKAYQKKYPNIIRYISHPEPLGAIKNALYAIRACHGEYIATLDADDYWTNPSKLKWQIQFLDEHPEFVLSCHRFKQYFEDTKQFSNDLIPNDLFKGKPSGIEFGQEMYFKHWLTQKLTVVVRKSAIENTPQLEANRYSWDAQIFWLALTKGKGYIHNFVGGIYSIPTKEIPSRDSELNYYSLHYLLIDELLLDDPDNPHLKKALGIYRNTLGSSQHKNRNLLDIRNVKNTDFTIVSDDDWGKEVYKAFGIEERSPFIGIRIFNADFVQLAYNFEKQMKLPLQFISANDSKYKTIITRAGLKTYPVALLGQQVELHFTEYNSIKEAKDKWEERVKRINWKNLFFKMDVSREDDNLSEILNFSKLDYPHSNKACFLSAFQKKKIVDLSIKKSVTLIDHWNPEPELLFPFSLNSFDLVGWLNGGIGIPIDKTDFNANIFRYDEEKQNYYFIQFTKYNITQLNALFYPDAYKIHFDEENSCAEIHYEKSSLEHFYLETREKLHSRSTEFLKLIVNLSDKESRHAFILAKGNKHHKLRVDFIAEETEAVGRYTPHPDFQHVSLQTSGLEQEIPEEFEWMHFDFSLIEVDDLEHLFSCIRGFSFYVNPNESAHGMLQIMSIFIGSVDKFEEILN